MRYDLVFLHTAAVHIETFTALANLWLPQARIHHLVDTALLADAQGYKTLPAELETRIQSVIQSAAELAPVVCCTCSTIGEAAERTFVDDTGRYSIRIDRAMADQAVQHAGCIKVLAALDSTIEPTEKLLASSAERQGCQVTLDTEVIEGAWESFLSGDITRYHQVIAHRLKQLDQDCELIVLAQASMAPAVQLVELDCPVLSSPELGIKALKGVLNDVAAGNWT